MACSFQDLFPEIYPLIVSHIPLHATPETLLSLALTNRRLSEIILPIVHQCLILRCESSGIQAFQRISSDRLLGARVRELHLLYVGVIKELEEIVASGTLPNLHTFGFHSDGYGDNPDHHPRFWTILREHCPRLRRVRLLDPYGYGHFSRRSNFVWLQSSGIFQIPDLSTLSLRVYDTNLQDHHCVMLLSTLKIWTHSLQTLSLSFFVDKELSLSALYSLNFPCLWSLSLDINSVNQPSEAMTFWTRHPNLESLTLVCADGGRSFADPIPQDFLPHLRHLKASFVDVRALAPILPQLVSLAVHESINSQVPYLLRSVIPGGLPGLKSLYFAQRSWDRGANDEGVSWYETPDGTFHESRGEKKRYRSQRIILQNYMHSIVHAAPNVEELGFRFDSIKCLSGLVEIADVFSNLRRLKSLYYKMRFAEGDKDTIAHVLALAKKSRTPGLQSVTNTYGDIPSHAARIHRDDSGNPLKVVIQPIAKGMEIGHEDLASLDECVYGAECRMD